MSGCVSGVFVCLGVPVDMPAMCVHICSYVHERLLSECAPEPCVQATSVCELLCVLRHICVAISVCLHLRPTHLSAAPHPNVRPRPPCCALGSVQDSVCPSPQGLTLQAPTANPSCDFHSCLMLQHEP